MKYVANSKLGIGEVVSTTDKFIEVFFSEVDETKKLLVAFAPKTFDTYEDAEASLNPEITEESANAIKAEVEADKKIMSEGTQAMRWLEEHNLEVSKKLSKFI